MRASGSVDSPSSATPGPSAARQLGPRLLHRVEEDAVGAELAHEQPRRASSSPTGSRRVPTSHGL